MRLMSDPTPEFAAGVERLKVLADPDRLHIAACLLEGSKCAGELAKQLGKDTAAVLDHLQVMVAAGFVQSEGVGQFATYSFRPEVSLAALALGDRGTIDLGCCQLQLTQISDRKPDERK